MPIQFDSSDVPETVDGFDFAKAGRFHFQVDVVDEGDDNNPMVITLLVLAGAPDTEVGKSHREYFNKPKASQELEKRKNTVKRFLLFAFATGILTPEEHEAALKTSKFPAIDFNLAIARQFCGELTDEEYEGKTRAKLGFNIWAIGSDQAKGIPLNEGMLAKQGDAVKDPFGGVKF